MQKGKARNKSFSKESNTTKRDINQCVSVWETEREWEDNFFGDIFRQMDTLRQPLKRGGGRELRLKHSETGRRQPYCRCYGVCVFVYEEFVPRSLCPLYRGLVTGRGSLVSVSLEFIKWAFFFLFFLVGRDDYKPQGRINRMLSQILCLTKGKLNVFQGQWL